jgi:hypothetical protein
VNCGPSEQGIEHRTQGLTPVREAVLHLRRNLRVRDPSHHAVSLHLPELLAQHLLRYGGYRSLQLREALDLASEELEQDHQLPPTLEELQCCLDTLRRRYPGVRHTVASRHTWMSAARPRLALHREIGPTFCVVVKAMRPLAWRPQRVMPKDLCGGYGAAVDDVLRAGDRLGLGRHEEGDEVCHFSWFRRSPDGNASE